MDYHEVSSRPLSPWRRARAGVARWLASANPAVYQFLSARGNGHWHGDIPWASPRVALSESRVALVSSGGVILKKHPRFDLQDPRGDCSYRVIPTDADLSDIIVSHVFYDSSAVRDDVEVMLPLTALHGLCREGKIGSVAPRHFSFSGAIPDPTELVTRFAPETAEMLIQDEVDLVLLTPA